MDCWSVKTLHVLRSRVSEQLGCVVNQRQNVDVKAEAQSM